MDVQHADRPRPHLAHRRAGAAARRSSAVRAAASASCSTSSTRTASARPRRASARRSSASTSPSSTPRSASRSASRCRPTRAIQFPLVELQTQCEMLRALIHKTAWLMDTYGAFSQSDKVSMCNYWANRLCCEAADRAMQVHGGLGYSPAQAVRAHLPPPPPLPHHRGRRGDPDAARRRLHVRLHEAAGAEGRRQRDGPGRCRRVASAPCSSHLTPPTCSRPSDVCSTTRSSPPSRRTCSTRCASPATSPTSSSARRGSDRTTPARERELLADLLGADVADPQAALAERIRSRRRCRRSRREAWTALVDITRADLAVAKPGHDALGGRSDARSRRRAWRRTSARPGHEEVIVGNLSTTTAGARRHNVLFDAEAGGTVHHLVATIVPFGETLINPIDAEAGVRALAEKAGVAVPHVHLARDGRRAGRRAVHDLGVRARRDRAPPRAAPRRRARHR